MNSDILQTLSVSAHSTTTSRRSIHKYLNKKCNSALHDKGLSMDNLVEDKIDYYKSLRNKNCDFDISSQVFPSNTTNLANITVMNDKENNSFISDYALNIIEPNEDGEDLTGNKPEFLKSWLMNQIPYKFLEPQTSNYILPTSINKQEREIAYNLLIRRIVDETLDRSSMFSRQPKDFLDLIHKILVRQFPDYDELKHRCKVRNYLKACRRNFQKNNGNIIMKSAAPYLTTGSAYKLMHQIYNVEKQTINILKKESERLKTLKMNKSPLIQSNIPAPSLQKSLSIQKQEVIIPSSNMLPILPIALSSINSSVKPIAQIYSTNQNMQTSQFPLLMPFNGILHSESIKKTNTNSLNSTSEEIRKSISEITKIFLNNGSNNNVKKIILQLKDTANFMEKIAETLEQSIKSSSV